MFYAFKTPSCRPSGVFFVTPVRELDSANLRARPLANTTFPHVQTFDHCESPIGTLTGCHTHDRQTL